MLISIIRRVSALQVPTPLAVDMIDRIDQLLQLRPCLQLLRLTCNVTLGLVLVLSQVKPVAPWLTDSAMRRRWRWRLRLRCRCRCRQQLRLQLGLGTGGCLLGLHCGPRLGSTTATNCICILHNLIVITIVRSMRCRRHRNSFMQPAAADPIHETETGCRATWLRWWWWWWWWRWRGWWQWLLRWLWRWLRLWLGLGWQCISSLLKRDTCTTAHTHTLSHSFTHAHRYTYTFTVSHTHTHTCCSWPAFFL